RDASLGELARRGAELACPWPPASTSHPERLAIQLRERERAGLDACSLLDWIAAHPESRELMWCHSPPLGGAGLLAPPAELLDAMRRPAPECPPAVGVEGVPLVAVRCADERDWRAVEQFKRDARIVAERKAALPELLAAHRLSRPHLIRAAGRRGDVLLDPYCRGGVDEW
ncbi:MAG TPA: hypothetical protein VL977_08720, partial [Solirubrobacteraceae bacterium]|nr:hypothetical protein [Solirubrobacteraceae bacterium]